MKTRVLLSIGRLRITRGPFWDVAAKTHKRCTRIMWRTSPGLRPENMGMGTLTYKVFRVRGIDMPRPIRYVRGRVYTLAVRVHYELFFARMIGDDPTGSGRAAVMMYRQLPRARREGLAEAARSRLLEPLCTEGCEAVGGDLDCTCIGLDEFKARVESRLVNTPAMPAPTYPNDNDPED